MKYVKKILMPRNAKLRGWRNMIVALVIIFIAYTGFRFYINSFEIYDFSHLTPHLYMGQMSEFVPLSGEAVPNMVRAAQNEYLALYIHPGNTTIAVYDKRNGHIWHSSPPDGQQDSRANSLERNIMQSIAGIRFYNQRDSNVSRWTFSDSVAHEQAEMFSIPNGVAIRYLIGNTDLGIHALPLYMEAERFQTRVLDQIYDISDRNWVARNFNVTDARPDFMRMSASIRTGVHAQRILRIFEEIGYTLEELELDNNMSGHESEVTFDLFTLYIEFALDGDSMVVNVPLNRIEKSNENNRISDIEIMRFFGAGDDQAEGFILIPSGSGALIEFNNNKSHEERFTSPVYGFDLLSNFWRPQVLQPIRLPVFGLNHGNAAMVAHIENGAALASVTADVAGRLNSYNFAWFSFSLRNSQSVPIGLPGSHRVNSMTIIQEHAYDGDITIRYHFIASDEVTLGDMADAYRNFLVSNGSLTPIADAGDRTFYLDIIGTADVIDFFLGIRYNTEQTMTTFEESNRILDILNAGGVNNVQMLLHGWFNGGLNHHVAKDVSRSRGLGSLSEMQELNARLEASGGALNPAVNFAQTFANSRNFNTSFEVARDTAGWLGMISTVSRQVLNIRAIEHNNEWFYLVHPGVIPSHVDSFIPSYSRNVGIGNLALTDLGNVLTESMYQRNAVDREHSRLIATEQIGRLAYEFPNIIVAGGNDYAIRYASHLVDVPIRADWFYIIDHEVPFFQMIMHGYIEFAGAPVNIQPSPDLQAALLNSMATGASPRFTMTGQPTRLLQFSPYERLYSTQYTNWVNAAIAQYQAFNAVYSNLRNQRIADFVVLGGTVRNNVTVTIFSNGTRIYVNNTNSPFDAQGVTIPPMDFVVIE